MAKIEPYKRRCGNTTRQVDEWIQYLFEGKDVVIKDHAHKDGNIANKYAEKVFLRRLEFEHNITLKRGGQLIFKKDENAYELLPF